MRLKPLAEYPGVTFDIIWHSAINIIWHSEPPRCSVIGSPPRRRAKAYGGSPSILPPPELWCTRPSVAARVPSFVESLGPFADAPPTTSSREAGVCSLAQNVTLEFGQSGKKMKGQLASGRCCVDVLRQ